MKKYLSLLVTASVLMIIAGCAFMAPTSPYVPGVGSMQENPESPDDGLPLRPTPTATPGNGDPGTGNYVGSVGGTVTGAGASDSITITLTSVSNATVSYTAQVVGNSSYEINDVATGMYYAMAENVTTGTTIPSTGTTGYFIVGMNSSVDNVNFGF